MINYICVTVMDRIRNEVIREEVGVMRDLAGRAVNCVLRWFGHVQRMDGKGWRKGYMVRGLRGARVELNQTWGG